MLFKSSSGKIKYRYHSKSGGAIKNKKIVCVETGVKYDSLTQCNKLTGFHISSLSKHLNFPEKHEKVNGFTFKWV